MGLRGTDSAVLSAKIGIIRHSRIGVIVQQGFFETWMDEQRPIAGAANIVVMQERTGGRAAASAAISQAALDHLAGLHIIESIGGMPAAADYIKNKLPAVVKTQSGDLGEILASEYITQRTDFVVPIKKLLWKDDRNTTMRGNDVIAGRDTSGTWTTLKAEVKSRDRLGQTVVDEAITDLHKHSGRPNPSSLAFISSRLREQDRHAEAERYEALQRRSPGAHEIEHMVFVFSGNAPQQYLAPHATPGAGESSRHLVGCVVIDHQDFIQATFAAINAAIP